MCPTLPLASMAAIPCESFALTFAPMARMCPVVRSWGQVRCRNRRRLPSVPMEFGSQVATAKSWPADMLASFKIDTRMTDRARQESQMHARTRAKQPGASPRCRAIAALSRSRCFAAITSFEEARKSRQAPSLWRHRRPTIQGMHRQSFVARNLPCPTPQDVC